MYGLFAFICEVLTLYNDPLVNSFSLSPWQQALGRIITARDLIQLWLRINQSKIVSTQRPFFLV